MSSNSYPFVSVIIPVYNSAIGIKKTLTALQTQTYPRDHFEVIIVDNGSTDETRDVAAEFSVKVLHQPIRGSYAARNMGIASAHGDIIAFTDSDCEPDVNWLLCGVQHLQTHHVDAVGGFVSFTFSATPHAAEYADALINIDNEYSITTHSMAATANLFVTRTTLHNAGGFNQKLRSGGDGEWSARAKKAGLSMRFSRDAIVYHPARTFRELITKHIRVGSGSMAIWSARGKSAWWKIAATLYLFTPLFLLKVPKLIRKKIPHTPSLPIFKILLVVYVCKICTGFGIIKTLFTSPR
jgi:glycosyltransferase AglE